jgi:hypothetical protein
MISWLFGWWVGWLIGWIVGCLVGWLDGLGGRGILIKRGSFHFYRPNSKNIDN